MREDLIERLRREADISARPGQMDRLNALADEFAAALEAAQTGLRYAVRVWVLSDEIAWSKEEIDEVVESIISDAKGRRAMTDRYEKIRKALAMGPTPGPWEPSYDKGSTRDIITQKEKYPICMVRGIAYVGQDQYLANGYFIAACDPDTIRALLDERDALEAENARLREAFFNRRD